MSNNEQGIAKVYQSTAHFMASDGKSNSNNGSINNAGNGSSDRSGVGNAVARGRAGGTFILPSTYPHIVIKEPNTTEPKKAKRKRITPEQLKELTAVFEKTDTPTHDIREELSKRLSMTNREVQVWFQNRRAKYNRQRAEQQRQMRTNAAIMYSSGMLVGPLPVPPPGFLHQHPHPPPPMALPPPRIIPQTFHPIDANNPGVHGNANGSTSQPAAASVAAQTQPPYLHGNAAHIRHHPQQSHSQQPSQPHVVASAPAQYADRSNQMAEPYRSHPYPRQPTLSSPPPLPATTAAQQYADAPLPSDSLSISVHAAAMMHPLASTAPRTAPAHPAYTDTDLQPSLRSLEHPAYTTSAGLQPQVVSSASAALAATTAHYPSSSSASSSQSPYTQHTGARHQQQQQPEARHLPQANRRNTVSGPTSPYNAGSTANNQNGSHRTTQYPPVYNRPLPAPAQAGAVVTAASPPSLTPSSALTVRARYSSSTPSDVFAGSSRYSIHRSPSPQTTHYNRRRHLPYPLVVSDGPAQALSSSGTVATTAAPTCKSAMASKGASSSSNSQVKLPSIQTLLANAGGSSSDHRAHTTTAGGAEHSALPIIPHPAFRARAYTSPSALANQTAATSAWPHGRQDTDALAALPPIHDSSPPPPPSLLTPEHERHPYVPATSGIQLDGHVQQPSAQHHDAASSLPPPHAHADQHSCLEDTQMRDAKLGIDVLASAAISVSSAMPNNSMPHLTPLSDLAPRSSSSQYQATQVNTATPPPMHSDQQLYTHCGEEGPSKRSMRKVTPVDGTMKKPANWRPW